MQTSDDSFFSTKAGSLQFMGSLETRNSLEWFINAALSTIDGILKTIVLKHLLYCFEIISLNMYDEW